ncbi:hypothetical protein [Streptomyces kanamyceticus]|uniref:Secreted protein n=1 Tax=Streptomyces kanamyceticus TaxID=1967 RepID=A0A5J6GDY7_STRKN|nr:hypothetical protein [Streptomyces kanamyceticus]QEU94120.1 hypothetical protein CP970_27320 [Streptomyces kanamyceticus]
MAARHRHRHRRLAFATGTTLLVVPAALGLTACDPEDAVDCVRAADAVSDGVDALRKAAQEAALYPDRADGSFDEIKSDLDEIRDKNDDQDVLDAVDEMKKAVDNIEDAVDDGDRTPDLRPIAAAGGKVTKACTP